MQKILITGGCGFIGRNLIEELQKNSNYRIRCLDRVKMSWLTDKIEFFEGDFTAIHLLESAFEDCDTVIHLASTTLPKTSNDDPEFDVSTNLVGAIRLLEASVRNHVKKFIFISSGGTVYGIPEKLPVSESHQTNPTCSYGIVKLAIEKYLRLFYKLYKLNTCSVRFANPYGRYQRIDAAQGAISVFCHNAINDIPINVWGDGSVSRDFIYIDDAINALIKLIHSDYSGSEINIGSGIPVSINQILTHIESELHKKIRVNYFESRKFDVPHICLDIAQARQLLNWTPQISIDNGIARTIQWQKKETTA